MKEPVTNKQKLYYTIGEVSDMFNVNQSLLRYWETEFKTINPKRSPKGTRYYSQKDIEEIKLIHYLLKERKLKIEGADKLVHGCMYLGLVWIGCFDIYRVSKFTAPKLILLVCGAIVWGGLMELLQGAMSMGRSADWYDFLANSCGAILGLILGVNSVPYLFRKCKKLS